MVVPVIIHSPLYFACPAFPRLSRPLSLREEPDGGLLDKLAFGVGVGHK